MQDDDERTLVSVEVFKLVGDYQQTSCEEVLNSVLLDYVCNVVEEDDGDIDYGDFFETFIAYIPDLNIQREQMDSWLLHLKAKLNRLRSGRLDSASSSESSSSCAPANFSMKTEKSEGSREVQRRSSSETQSLDSTVKAKIISKHSFIEEKTSTNQGQPTKKPLPPVKPTDKETKVRYLDGKVVSTKGERFVNLKQEESEEMKKTYVNLKPARKYRFH